jgi:outer membrane protein assembly factor BamD
LVDKFAGIAHRMWRFHSSTGRASRTVRTVLTLALLVIPLAGCSSWFNKDDTLGPDLPAEQLYNEGVYLLNQRQDWKAAAKKFEEVERQHPYSEWARKALIMSAYAHYEGTQYDDSVSAAKRYVTLHPGSTDAAYAQYLIGSSYFDQIPDISRDQQRTERAMQALDEVVRKYPNTEYATAAKRKVEVARDQLAGKEMDIGRYYMNKRDYTGAINRFKIVVTRYQTTRHVEEALLRLTEAYLSLGVVSEAQTSAAVLGHNFPDSPWYKNAYTLLQSGGLSPSENKQSWISKLFAPKPTG